MSLDAFGLTRRKAQMEQTIRSFIDDINQNHPDTMCALLQGSFVSCSDAEQTLLMSYPAQRVHRDVIATMIDFTAGCLSVYMCGKFVVTATLQVSYLRPVPSEGEMIVRARSTQAAQRLVHTIAEVYPAADPDALIATGSCVYMA